MTLLTSESPSSPAIAATTPARAERLLLGQTALAFVVLAVILLLTAAAGASFGTVPRMLGRQLGWFEAWVRWDAGWYRSIAEQGYFYLPGRQSSVAFFPTYPLAMRAGSTFLHPYVAGIGLTLVSGLSASVLFASWCSQRMAGRAAATAVALLLLYPFSLYLYGAVYADALLLLTALAAFALLESGRPWLAGLVGILATAGRPVGIAVTIGLAVRAVELAGRRAPLKQVPPTMDAGRPWSWPAVRRRWVHHVRLVRWSDTGVLVSGLGLVGYAGFLWLRFGNPLTFVAAQAAPPWNQGAGWHTWLKLRFWKTVLSGDAGDTIRLLVPAALCLLVIVLLPRVRRRFGWGYAAYTAVIVALPVVGTKDFLGAGRYLLVAFPVFALLAEPLAASPSRWLRPVVLTVSAAGLLFATALYGFGYLVS